MRILYIEDDQVLAEMVQIGLRPLGFAVDWAATAEEGLDALAGVDYGAVVLDLGLPDTDGLSVLKALRARKKTTPVLILSARNRTPQRVAGLDAGADDYLTKPFDIAELAARLRALLRRPGGLLDTALTCGNLIYIPAEHTAEVEGKPVPLPRREAMVLETLLRSPERPVSKSRLEDSLYAFGEEVASNSVEVHIHYLRRRLAAAAASVRIKTRRGTGYVIAAADRASSAGQDT